MATSDIWKLDALNDERKKKSVIAHLQAGCNRAVDKELLQFGIAQEVFELYVERCEHDQLQDITARCIEGAPHFLASRPGAAALLRILGVASPKNRKVFIKALKNQFLAIAQNRVTCVVLWRLLTTVDDTVLLTKSVLSELLNELRALCFDEVGKNTVLLLLSGVCKRYLSADDYAGLQLPAPSSKKSASIREEELRKPVVAALKGLMQSEKSILAWCADSSARDILVELAKKDGDCAKILFDKIVEESKNSKNFEYLHTKFKQNVAKCDENRDER